MEVGLADSLHIHQRQAEHEVDMFLVIGVVLAVRTQVIYVCILEVFCFGDAEHLVSLGLVEEFALLVEKLQRVPHTGVMAGGDDNAAACTLHGHSNLGGGGRGQTDVDHIETHAHQGSAHHILDHLTTDTCITTHHYLVAGDLCSAAYECSVGRCELHNVEGIKSVPCSSANGSADA